MSKFLSLIEENTPQDTPDEFDKEPIELIEKYMALVELNLGYAGEVAADAASPAVEKRAGELGAMIQEELHHFMDNFGGTSVEDAEDGEELPVEDQEMMAGTDTKKMTDMANTAAKIMSIKSPSLKDQVLNPASRKIQMAKRTLADKIHKAAKKFEI